MTQFKMADCCNNVQIEPSLMTNLADMGAQGPDGQKGTALSGINRQTLGAGQNATSFRNSKNPAGNVGPGQSTPNS